MEPLQESIKKLHKDIIDHIEKSNQLKKTFKHANIKCSDAEREHMLARAIDNFTNELNTNIHCLLEDTEVGEKLDELKALMKECNEENKKLGVDEGYRPVDPCQDICGHLHTVQTCYNYGLETLRSSVDNELGEKKAELSDKLKYLAKLEQEIQVQLRK